MRERAIAGFPMLHWETLEAVVAPQSGKRPSADATLFCSAIENSSTLFMVLDERGRIEHANPACCTALNRSLEQLLGRSFRITRLVPSRPGVLREIVESLSQKSEWRGEFESRARRGEPRILQVAVASRFTDIATQHYIIELRDVTHQRRLEYIAEAANLVENMGYVFAGLRHELGNPVNSIKTALSVLQQSLPTLSTDRVESYITRILDEVARVEYLLRCMASFNATQKLVLETVDVADFVMHFARIIRPDVELRRVQLVVSAPKGCGHMLVDPQALHQVLLNLVTNALDAVSKFPAPGRGIVWIVAERRARHLRIVVSDNGPGIRPEQRPHVFKPFHTTKAKGTGLGLAITRKLVTLMRGTIELDTSRETGVGFVITLELAPQEITTWRPPS